jgi:hypothetical protein
MVQYHQDGQSQHVALKAARAFGLLRVAESDV